MENKTHSGGLPILQPLLRIYFANEKASSSQKQQQHPDLQTYLIKSFQLFADTLKSRFEDLTNKIVEKSASRARAKEKRPGKGSNLMMREQALNHRQNQKVSSRRRMPKTVKWVSLHANDDSGVVGKLNVLEPTASKDENL